MMENDDKLLKQFFAENRHEVEDNGFSRRVMKQLPQSESKFARIWTFCGFSLALLLFVATDGLRLLLHTLREVIEGMIAGGQAMEIDPKSLLLVAVVLTFLSCKKIISIA